MAQKLNRNSDAILNIKLVDKAGTQFRVKDVNVFSIKIFTTNPEVNIECKYQDSVYTGIIEGETTDSLILNASDINKFEKGILKYTYHIQVNNELFNDGIYNEVIEGSTNIYLI
jgi:hypothetical protein